MTKRILLIAVAFAAALGTTWWFAGNAPEQFRTDRGNDAEDSQSRHQTPQIEKIAYAVPSNDDQLTGIRTPLDRIREVDSNWESRYPGSQVLETRIQESSDGVVHRQQLLKTKVERIPWVLWEERFAENEEGDFVLISSFANVGNVILVDADPEFVSETELAAFIEENDLFVERESRVSEYKCLGVENPQLGKLESLIEDFQSRFPGVIAELDTIHFTSALPSDWSAAKMWGLQSISAPDAWEFETGGTGEEVVVAIIDTGVEISHSDLAANIFINPAEATIDGLDSVVDSNRLVDDRTGWDFVDGDSNPQDNDGHGTHVAGIVGAVGNNGRGAVGVNWNVKILPLRVGDEDGLRNSAINDALAYVAQLKDDGINIVATNNSYGSSGYSSSTRDEIQKHQSRGILFAAASGNDGINIDLNPQYPAGYDLSNIISVGNSNQESGLSGSSNYGQTTVDLSAPGSEIYSTYIGNGYAFLSGTSMASPMVAGAVALVAQANPGMTGNQIKVRLMETADRISSQTGRSVTGGRLNLLAALRPELTGHELSIANIEDGIVLLSSLESQPIFELDYKEGAALSSLIVEGESMGELVDLGSGKYRFEANGEGVAKLRFVSELNGIEKVQERTVVFGALNDVTAGLIHHYDFSGSGTSVLDKAGSSNGTLIGASRATSEFGSAAGFDATTEKMSFNGTFDNQVTITALVRSDDMSVSPHPRIVNMPFYYLYFSSGVGSAVPDGNRRTLKFYSHFETSGQESFGVWNAPPNSVTDDQWYLVAATYDGSQVSNTPELYINGAPQTVWMQQEPSGSLVNPGGLSYIGNNSDDSRAFDGLISDVRVYDRQLSAGEISQVMVSLIGDRWQDAKIVGPEIVKLGSEYEFSVQVGDSIESGIEVNWVGEDGSDIEVASQSGDSASIRFSKLGSQKLQAQISDGMVTYVIAETIDTGEGELQSGNYVGETGSGGLVLLEVAEDLATGFISIFDPGTGFYRIRETVTIDENGYFETLEDSLGKIVGTALFELTGEVTGYDVAFSGEIQPTTNADKLEPYEGSYFGGAIDVAGDSIQADVLKSGEVFLWRTGPEADFAIGTLGEDGVLEEVSSRALEISLTVDPEALETVGTWGTNTVYLSKDAIPTESELWGGAYGGLVSGEGDRGLFGRLIFDRSDLSNESLGAGVFASSNLEAWKAGPFVVLDARGRLIHSVASGSELSLGDLGARLEISDWLQSPVEGIRVQTPIVESGYGVIVFSIQGDEPKEILARGLGKVFAEAGGEDPKLSLYEFADEELSLIATNDDWRDGALFASENEYTQGAFIELAAGFDLIGLSILPDEAKDAAFRIWLDSGVYVLVMELNSGNPGVGLLEIYGLE